MSEVKIKFTYEDYLQLPEDKRYEIIEGELYMVPSPNCSHQTISQKLFLALHDHITSRGLGTVFYAPLDVVPSEENVIQPDLIFISRERSYIITDKNICGMPDLVVEILSPGTAYRDKGIKRKLYAKYDVKEYWIVDPDQRMVEVLALEEGEFLSAGVYTEKTPLKSPILTELGVDLSKVF